MCDGTNNGANPSQGTTPIDQLDAAASLNSFSYDGTWSSAYDDFFITSIGASTQTSTQFWGLLVNDQYSPVGGCQMEVESGDRTLWAFDAFSKDHFLKVTPDYAVAEAGSGSVTVTTIDGEYGGVISGVSIAGQMSDNYGHVSILIPSEPGCYQFKATKSGSIRSNAFYLTVVDQFAESESVPSVSSIFLP